MSKRQKQLDGINGALHWLIEPASEQVRARRVVAFVWALGGLRPFDVSKLGELSARYGIPAKTLWYLRNELRVRFNMVGASDFTAGIAERQTLDKDEYIETEEEFTADSPQGYDES